MTIWQRDLRWISLSTAVCTIALATSACNTTKTFDATAAADPIPKVAVTVTDTGCNPAAITTEEGKTTFVINNKSSHALEFEILAGVKVVDERENIAPGFVQELKATLEAGNYDLVCGKRGTPNGKLAVKSTGESRASTPIDQGKLVGAIAEYKVYVTKEVDQLVAETKRFTEAVDAGDLATAQKLYAPTRSHYEQIEPIAELFSDLDGSMDARPDDFAKKEADPAWTGFHRLEKALFQAKTTAGTTALTAKLRQDTQTLQKRLATLTIEPKNMVGGAAALIEEVAATKITGEEDRYSHTDLWDFQANVDGSQKIVDLLRPLIQKANPDLLAKVDISFKQINDKLVKYKTSDGGFVTYDKLTDSDRTQLKTIIATHAEDLAKLRGTLGVD